MASLRHGLGNLGVSLWLTSYKIIENFQLAFTAEEIWANESLIWRFVKEVGQFETKY